MTWLGAQAAISVAGFCLTKYALCDVLNLPYNSIFTRSYITIIDVSSLTDSWQNVRKTETAHRQRNAAPTELARKLSMTVVRRCVCNTTGPIEHAVCHEMLSVNNRDGQYVCYGRFTKC